MSKFHTAVSRRDFMKGLGLAGAGLGAAAAASPVFRDLDEVVGPSKSIHHYPWWVQERDLGDPTIEIDWSQVIRMDRRVASDQTWRSSTEPDAVAGRENKTAILKKYCEDKFPEWTSIVTGNEPRMSYVNTYPAASVRDLAMAQAVANTRGGYLSDARRAKGASTFLGFKSVKTPEDLGLPRWAGTPEENTRMVRNFSRFIGASDVGVVELDSNTRKLIWAHDGSKPYVFKDVDQAEDTADEYVIPNKCKYMIVWTHTEPTELAIRAPSAHGCASTHISYATMPMMSVQIQEFVRGLGYQGLAGYSSALAPSNPFGVLSGMGEHGRMCFVVISPREGSTLRGMNRILTDFPLAPTKPIDFGCYKFCETCKICAEMWPCDAIPIDDSSWEAAHYQPPGFKGFRLTTRLCTFCIGCQATCPFTSTRQSLIHAFVGAAVANTTIFNGFFAEMERTFGYGMKNPETWWDMDNEPVYGLARSWA
jgi:reductive dehalogenase